jgi:hypothetical protein
LKDSCTSDSTTSENLEYALKRKMSGRAQMPPDREDHHVAIGAIADSIEADVTGDRLVDDNFDFDDWSSQIIPRDLPLDITWPILDAETLSPFPASNALSRNDLLPSPASMSPNLVPLLQDYQTATTSFPDTYLLPIPALGLLRACLTIAKRLGIAMQLWDCTSVSPFYVGPSPAKGNCSETSANRGIGGLGIDIDITSLPKNLQPTRTQCLLPHHPLLDVLPWPSVRDKLIMYFAQPEGLRPADLGMEQLVGDLEDEAEGVVVRAGQTEPWDVESWEVGKALEKRWWFVLDSKVKRRR